MIPGLLAKNVSDALKEFIVTGFETDTWPFAGKFEQLVNSESEGEAFIKGPYVSINLPFAKNTERKDLFAELETEHSPFVHQQQAWERLRSDKSPKSTIVATGTGSGKTECFLYPIVDHCHRSDTRGIKAIIIYPMNALATDQAKRFAEIIHSTAALNGTVRVGLFIGGADNTDEKKMAPQQVITCKETLRKNPPDILLTNYKMLDFLLMRPRDQELWRHNTPESLKYLVVDELHTFDGAQGSDLAMLIRRLKARLSVPKGELVCIGTSATLGSDSSMGELADYASDIFDAKLTRGSIVGESRENETKFLGMIEYNMLLDPSFTPNELLISSFQSLADYLSAQVRLFFGDEWLIDPDQLSDRIELGRKLKSHPLFHNLLHVLRSGPATLASLAPAIHKQLPQSLRGSTQDVLISLLSLIAHARGDRYPGEPFVSIRLQTWARELRRIVARVGNDSVQQPVNLLFSDDLKKETGEIYLPIVQCNECHSTAWLTCLEQGEQHVEQELRTIYTKFFARDRQVRILLPLKDKGHEPASRGLIKNLCPSCGHLQLQDGVCNACQEEALVQVFEPDLNKSVKKNGVPTLESQRLCAVCQASSSLILFGARAASLSSVVIHQLYSDRVNDDKKLIAFSDSVQDAAHRAGFFAARTWQNNVRMAISKAITSYVIERKENIPLVELLGYLPRFWLESEQNLEKFGPLDFITQFLPPNLQSHEDYLLLKENLTLDAPERLIDLIGKRLAWEALAEFGVNSHIGRSLERTGVASLSWDPTIIEEVGNSLRAQVKEELGYELGNSDATYLVWGIALRMKRQGAIFDPVLKGYIENGGVHFVLNRLPFLPNFQQFSALPRFPAESAEKGFEVLHQNHQASWYVRWVTYFLTDDRLVEPNFISDLLKKTMEILVENGLCISFETIKGNDVWALNPDMLSITTKLSTIRLEREMSVVGSDEEIGKLAYGSWFIPEEWKDKLIGLPSLDNVSTKKGVEAKYVLDVNPRQSMYKNYFLNGEIQRVIAHEHTGLLDREYRESLEKRFMAEKDDRKSWYENLLSATPTLEMGIDIGDLSSVMLCSVPPSQANYLQRVGRGGRRDGNSFVTTMAVGNPHDLFFYADPKKMLAGDVQAPAIYLNASMVLRRQLLAFGFDQWGMVSDGGHTIPRTMQPVLDAVEKGNQRKFPYTLIQFIQMNRDELWEKFSALLGDKVTSETRSRLKGYLLGTNEDEDGLHIYVLDRIKQFVNERSALVRLQKSLEAELKSVNAKPQDEARDHMEMELTTELEGIKRLKMDLNRKDTLNFFTDEGLLPNYAFPEEGTTLRSVIYRRLSQPITTEDGKTSNYQTRVFEYSRPAHAALRELAPENVFYASNRKVEIERVEMAKGENLETWRLCPGCSYSQHEVGANKDHACPRCKDPMWSNVSQLMPMVKLRQVYANTREEESHIGDESDNREPTFYNQQMLIDFDKDDVVLAYAMKSISKPFGFEFIKKVSFREINFGKQGSNDQLLSVAGVDLARPGFRLCKECGTVQKSKKKSEHLFKCQFRKESTPDVTEENPAAGIIDCLYLYRQYESEAVRILMPRLSASDDKEKIQSFVATIQLGLRERFGGKVDHLNLTMNDEPIPGSSERSQYLVIYDTVPGGTGYLHTLLAVPENIIEILKLAKEVMETCSCQESPDLDGCYNCLYAYRNSYGMENTSRSVALELLAEILDGEIELEPIAHLGKIRKNVWADSELESRFPSAIQSLSQHDALGGKRIRITKDIIRGKVGFKLEIGELIYTVEPHVQLNEKQGVAYPCEPDFVFSLDKEAGVMPVAVFLDGYKYHKDIVHEDLMKRQGISLLTNMITWSLTWRDVNNVFAADESKIPNAYRENTQNSPSEYIREISSSKGLSEHEQIVELSPLLLLLRYLGNPDKEKWVDLASIRAISWLDQGKMQDKNILGELRESADTWPSQFNDATTSIEPLFSGIHKSESVEASLTTFISGGKGAIQLLDPRELTLCAIYKPINTDSEEAQRTWQKLLQILNLGQFLPFFFAGTDAGVSEGHYSKLQWGAKPERVEDSAWDDVLRLVVEEARGVVNVLADAGVELPIVGFELEHDLSGMIAEAELAWETAKLVILLQNQEPVFRKVFEDTGWKVFTTLDDMKPVTKILHGDD